MTTEELDRTIAEVWQLFRENGKQLKKMREQSDERHKKAMAELKETREQSDERHKKAMAELKETREQSDEQHKKAMAEFKEMREESKKTAARFEEIRERFKETDAIVRRTSRSIKDLEGLFGRQWGRLIEALVAPNTVKLFQEWGIDIHYKSERIESTFGGHMMELDIVLENDQDVVIVEVKTHLKVKDVKEFLDDLATLTDFFPRFKNHTVYGAVAGLEVAEGADRFAYRKGLFVLGVAGDAYIKNDALFRPRKFVTPRNGSAR